MKPSSQIYTTLESVSFGGSRDLAQARRFHEETRMGFDDVVN